MEGSNSRSTIRIRSIHDGTMFHLVFDGNIGRLSTATLKRHLEPITNCGAPYLELYLRGRRLRDLDTGTQVGFQDGVVLDLRIAKSASSHDGTVPKPDVSSGRTGIRHYPLSTRGNAPPARASPSEHPRRSKYRFQSTGRHNASWRGSGSESSSDGVECLFIEDEGGDSEGDEVIANESFNTRRHHSVQHVLPSQSHPSGTQQSRSLELKDDLNWLIENKRFETERMLKEFKLRRHEILLAQQAAMLEKEFEEVQRVLTYENLRGDLIQREVRKSRELEALRRPQWGGIR